MGYLDNSGLAYLWSKITSKLAGKQDKLSLVDKSLTMTSGKSIYVTTPVQRVLSQEEYDALSEAERNRGLYVIRGEGGGTSGGGLPSGCIVIWSGAEDAVPSGWALCDGANGTPDLRGRFVLGAGEVHPVGETGGEEEVTLTVAQMPEHRHVLPTAVGGTVTSGIPGPRVATTNPNQADYYENIITSAVGTGGPHNNMPPYYVLAYIMKL